MSALLETPLESEAFVDAAGRAGEPALERTVEPSGEVAWGPVARAQRARSVSGVGTVSPLRRPPSEEQRAVYRRRRIGAAVVALVLVLLLALGLQAAVSTVASLVSPAEAAAPAVPASAGATPVTLGLSGADLNLPLSDGGTDKPGQIDPPEGEAVWYAGHDRVVPGQVGTAVIAGRAAGEDGQPTDFAQVTSLNEGDRVVVTFRDGVTLELDVVSTSLVDRKDLQSSELLWGDQRETRRVALVTSDEVTDDQGDSRGTFVAIAEMG